MQLNLVHLPGIRTPPRTRPTLVALARRLAPDELRVQLVLADDVVLRRLNREFRRRDRTTDVLSFVYESTGAPRGRRGARRRPARARRGHRHEGSTPHAELYVSMARARAQARARRHSLGCELVLLALHGMLHLQGHDHEHPRQARRMRAAEAPQLRWLAQRAGWPLLAPLVPATGTARGAS